MVVVIITTAEPRVSAEAFERGTGWSVKPEGACRGESCVPLPAGTLADDGTVDALAVAARLNMPVVTDNGHGVASLGPAVLEQGKVLETAAAPDLVLPTIDGDEFRLSSLRGQKVLIVAWAPY